MQESDLPERACRKEGVDLVTAPGGPDIAHAADAPVLLEHAQHLGLLRLVAPRKIREPGRVGPLRQAIMVGGQGDRQDAADRLDPVCPSMSVDERRHHFDRRSNSDIAKHALALRRISLA